MNTILSIAGSDPSGGAGIQADLKTFAVLGCYGAAAITAITCQNTMGVSHCAPLSPQLVCDQVAAVVSDMAPSHIKIGMTATGEIAAALSRCLASFEGEIIFDPVWQASAGQSLLDTQPQTALAPLLARVTVLTPNISELIALSGQAVTNQHEAIQAGRTLMNRYENLQALCIKGGHLHEEAAEVVDLLICRRTDDLETSSRRHPRHQTNNSHGTGCTFASAFAAYHARYGSYQEAFVKTVHFIDTLLACSSNIRMGQGRGPLLHHCWHTAEDDGRAAAPTPET